MNIGGKGVGIDPQPTHQPTYLNGELHHHRFDESGPLRWGVYRVEPALGIPLSHRLAPLVLAEPNGCHHCPNEVLDQYQRIR